VTATPMPGYVRFSVLLVPCLALCVGRSKGSERKEQNSRPDNTTWFHVCCLLATPRLEKVNRTLPPQMGRAPQAPEPHSQ
jgi:hypothetical protein